MKKFTWAFFLALSTLFFACKKELNPSAAEPSAESNAKKKNSGMDDVFRFYALGDGNRIDLLSTGSSVQLERSITVTGLQNGERLLSIDFRPATGQLYGLGSTSRLYFINLQSGVATQVGIGPFAPALSGTVAGFDFNPTVDRIRVVTSNGQNLRLNPETGVVVIEDGTINGAPGAVVTSVAYTNSFAGAATTTLYDIDVATDKLFKQNPPNDGTLELVGKLNANLEGEGGFDIAPNNGSEGFTGLALYRQNKKTTLYAIDLNTGRARKIEKFDKGDLYYGIAIPTDPVAYAVNMNSLLIFNPMMPSSTFSKTITGLQTGETILGIDFRPATGALYALGSNSRIYTINTANGAASFVAGLTSAADASPLMVNGTSFGFDFNPVPDRIRIVSNTGQNLRVNPATGVTITDGSINGEPGSITAAAYTNSFAGTTSTTLYVIASDNNLLYIQNPPNDGTLTAGKPLGVDIEANNGFDIGGSSNMAYGIFTSGGQNKLYSINLASGMAMPVGNFDNGVTGFALGLGF
jgi:hypothetical protein